MAALAALVAQTGVIGIVIDAVIAVGVIGGIFLYSRRDKVDHRSLDTVEPGQLVRPKKRKKARAR